MIEIRQENKKEKTQEFPLDVKIVKKNKAEMLNTLQPKCKSIDQVTVRKPKINVNKEVKKEKSTVATKHNDRRISDHELSN